MNKYMRAIGFGNYESKNKINSVFCDAKSNPDEHLALVCKNAETIVEMVKMVGDGIGIKWIGTMEGREEIFEKCIPIVEGTQMCTRDSVNIEEKVEGNVFLGAFEDMRAGVFFIFFLQNVIDYLELKENSAYVPEKRKVALAGLSIKGTVLLPLKSNKTDLEKKELEQKRRIKLLTAAKNGDERAMENLAFQDMDTYSKVSKRIRHEDVFSIVEASFMPYSLESDLYSLVADITQVKSIVNTITGEKVWRMALSYNGILVDVYINQEDLLGEPKIGRRFKGNIWLQGRIER